MRAHVHDELEVTLVAKLLPSGGRRKCAATVAATCCPSCSTSHRYHSAPEPPLLLSLIFSLLSCRVMLPCPMCLPHSTHISRTIGLLHMFPAADPSLLPPGKPSRLVGVVSLSFSDSGREDFRSLAPPAQQPYLSNMAVDPKFRR